MNSASVAVENETSEQSSSDSENDDIGSEDETEAEEDETEVEEDEIDVEDGDAIEDDDDGDENDLIDDEMKNNLSSDGESEVCAVCLNKFIGQELGCPETCNHTFCLQCLIEWSKNTNTCPIDRTEFSIIFAKNESAGSITKKIRVTVNPRQPEDALPEDTTACEVCRSGDREHRLLLCDACDLAYHCECLDPPLWRIPTNEWFCPPCATILNKKPKKSAVSGQQRVIPRTIVSEAVRLRIQRLREGSDGSESQLSLPMPRAPVQRKQSVSKTGKRKVVRRRRRRRIPQKTVVLARTKQSVLFHGKTRVRVNVGTQVKYKRRRRRRRKYRKRKTTTKRTVRTKRSLLASKPLAAPSTKQRIADRLGLCKLPSGQQIPYVKKSGTSSASSSRAENLPTLSLFGNRDQLMDFGEDFSGEIKQEINTPIVKSDPGPSRSSTAANFDLLGDIMAEQNILHLRTNDLTICKDGSLKLKEKTVSVNTATIKNEQRNCSTVEKESNVLYKENVHSRSEKPKPILIKQEDSQSKNAKRSSTDGDAKVDTYQVKYTDHEPKIHPKTSFRKEVFNHRMKTEVGNDFLDSRDSHSKSPVVKRCEERNVFIHQENSVFSYGSDSSLGIKKSSELQAGIQRRKMSNDINSQVKKEKSNSMIRKERSSDSLSSRLSESAVKLERRTISSMQADHHGRLSNCGNKVISSNTQDKSVIESNCIDRGKSIKMDPFKDMIDNVSRKIDEEMNKSKLEKLINLSQIKTFENKKQTKDKIHHTEKVPPTYKHLELEKADALKNLNYDSDIRNSSMRLNTFKIKRKRVSSSDPDCHSKKNIPDKSSDISLNKSLTSSWEKGSQHINNPIIRNGENLSEANEGVDVLANRSMVQERGNIVSNVKVKTEALAPSNPEDLFVNRSQTSSRESVNSYSGNVQIKIEALSSSSENNVYENPLSSPSLGSVTSYSNNFAKIEALSSSSSENDMYENPLSSPYLENVNSYSNINVKIEPFSLSNHEDDTYVNPLQSPSSERVNSDISNLKVKIEPLSPSNYENVIVNQPSGLSEEGENSSLNSVRLKVESLQSNHDDHVHQSPSLFQESVNSNISNINIKVEQLSPIINEDASVNQSASSSHGSTSSIVNIPKVKVEAFWPSLGNGDVFINKCGIEQTLDQNVIDETVVKLEKSPLDDFGTHNCRQNSNIIEKNIKTEILEEAPPDCIILYEKQNLKLEDNSHSSFNKFLNEEPLIMKGYDDRSISRKTPNLYETETPALIINEIGRRKRNSSQDNDEVIILFENQVSKKKKIKIKKERDSFETTDHNMGTLFGNTNTIKQEQFSTPEENCLIDRINVKVEKLSPVYCTSFENMVSDFVNSSTFIKEEKHSSNHISCQKNTISSVDLTHENPNPLLTPCVGEKQSYSKKVNVKAERQSPMPSPRNEYSTCLDLNFSTATVKSEIASPQADFTSAENSDYVENVKHSSIDIFTNENNLDNFNVVVPQMKIKTELGEDRKLSDFDDSTMHSSRYKMSHESPSLISDTYIEVSTLQESSKHQRIIYEKNPDNLKEMVSNFFGQETKIEKSSACELQRSHSDELNQWKREISGLERKSKEISEHRSHHSSESSGNKLRRTISVLEPVFKRSKQNNENNNVNANITNNGMQDVKDSFVDLSIVKIEGISNRANNILNTMDIGNSSVNYHNSLKNNTQLDIQNSNNITSVIPAPSIQPTFRIEEENYSCNPSCENNLHPKLESYSPGSVPEKELPLVDDIKIKVERCSPVTSPKCDFLLNSSRNLDYVKSEQASLLNVVSRTNAVKVKSEKLSISDSSSLSHREHLHVNGISPMTVKTEKRKMDSILESKNNNHIPKRKKLSACDKDVKIVNSPHEHKHKKNGSKAVNTFSRIILLKQNFNASKNSENKWMDPGKTKVKEEDEELKQKIEKEVKRVLYPFYKNGSISKKMHYDILHKSVPKVFLNCNNVFHPDKIKKLVCAYVAKMTKSSGAR